MTEFNNPNFSIDLSDQVALVTGASSGLGYRFSKVLAKCGAKVALSARRVDKLEKLSEEIKSDGGDCMVVPIDMVDRDTIRDAVQKVEEGLGTINTLINNAGMVDAQWAIKQSDELIDNVVATNLVGPYLLSNEVARRLIEKKEPGRMVNIASIAAFNISPNSASVLYSTTKSAIVRMTESLAVEWARNHINVNAIAPGMFSSEMLDGMLERIGDMSQSLPRKRICMPEQMDSTLLYLVSPSSECVTGTCIKIDDGQSPR
jgi:NAD(P)-dependent dehydrogenase (short-subunit alcohol dehydrogenase family)|tara:strand:- start:679 stop:1458 length:780 start_codon:yes stop_codon:yes gene_type:complete